MSNTGAFHGQPLILPNYTPLARKYGHPRGSLPRVSHRVLKGTGKSGLTPLSPFRAPENPGRKLWKDRIYRYQALRYYGFSAREMKDLEAFSESNDDRVQSTLNNPIHPLYQKAKWDRRDSMLKHMALLPVGGPHGGYWEVDNPIVWKILKPCLQLCSSILDNSHFWPWFDALFQGEYRSIDPSRIPPESQNRLQALRDAARTNIQLYSFHCRDSRTVYRERDATKKIMLELSDHITFGLFSGYTRPETGMPLPGGAFDNGATVPDQFNDRKTAQIRLSLELLQPLLLDTLKDSERMAIQMNVASALIHETAHCFHQLYIRRYTTMWPENWDAEFYFENDFLNEIGHSLENVLWNGRMQEIVGQDDTAGERVVPGLPVMGFISCQFFHMGNSHYQDSVLPLNDTPNYNDYYPTPARWVHKLFQRDFWEAGLQVLGSDATQMEPLTYGKRFILDQGWQANPWRKYLHRNGPLINQMRAGMGVYHISNDMPPNERLRRRVINDRFAHARRVTALYSASDLNARTRGPENSWNNYDEDDAVSVGSEPDIIGNPSRPPRWEEITQYLFANRGPTKLALDSLYFKMPEPTLYNYIMNHGGLNITIQEFRDFMVYCTSQKTLFSADYTYPHIGHLTRLPHGWPPRPSRESLPRRPPVDYRISDVLRRLVRNGAWNPQISTWSEFRDIDCEHLRQIANWSITTLSTDPPFDEDQWWDLMCECANNEKWFTHGPKGVIRWLEEEKGKEVFF